MHRSGAGAPFAGMVETHVRIRPMRRRDLTTVVDLETALFQEEGPWDFAQYEETWADGRMVMLVAEVGGSFAGYGFFEMRGTRATIHALAIVLQVRVGNKKAKALYESFHFAVTTVRRNYYRRGMHAEEMVRQRRGGRRPVQNR